MRLYQKLKSLLENSRLESATRGFVCDFCGTEIFDYPHRFLCENCDSKIERNDNHTCEKCGRKTVQDGVCTRCKAVPPNFSKGKSVYVYTGITTSIINRFKHYSRELSYALSKELSLEIFKQANRLYETQTELNRAEFYRQFLIVPVPMFRDRQAERGYNQAAELGKAIAKRTGFAFDDELLIKTRETGALKEKDARARGEEIRGAFRVVKRKKCRERYIILVDDVMTSGTTGSECARLLFGAGAKDVYFFTIAALADELRYE